MTPQFISLGNGGVRFLDTGGDGPAVLMSHGIGESLEFWQPQIEALGKTMRLVVWDMPGYGLSDTPQTTMTPESVAKAGWLLLDHLGVKGVHLVGNSLGGAVSLRMAGQAPARVRSLLLANAAMLGTEVFGAFKLMTLPLLGELMNKPSAKAVDMQIRAIVLSPSSISPSLRAVIARNVHRPGASAYFLAALRSNTSLRGQYPAVWQESHRLLGQLQMPTLILHGRQDVVLPAKHSEKAHALVPGSELQIWDDCGHTPQLERPTAFNTCLIALVKRAEA
ncbi:MAG: alpha/beta fold hydrolase [Hydrogenophaga sp.]